MKGSKQTGKLKMSIKKDKDFLNSKPKALLNIMKSCEDLEACSYDEIMTIRYLINKYLDLVLSYNLRDK